MVSIPKQIPHRHTNSESDTDIKEDLTTEFAHDRREVADLVGSWETRWRWVLGPVNNWILYAISAELASRKKKSIVDERVANLRCYVLSCIGPVPVSA